VKLPYGRPSHFHVREVHEIHDFFFSVPLTPFVPVETGFEASWFLHRSHTLAFSSQEPLDRFSEFAADPHQKSHFIFDTHASATEFFVSFRELIF